MSWRYVQLIFFAKHLRISKKKCTSAASFLQKHTKNRTKTLQKHCKNTLKHKQNYCKKGEEAIRREAKGGRRG